VPDPVLTLLKYVFLAILYLFFLRVLRAVWVELREPKPGTAGQVLDPSQVAGFAPTQAPASPGAWPVPHAAPVGGQVMGHGADPTIAARIQSSAPTAKLVAVSPEALEGREFMLSDDEVTVGRAGGCAVLLPDDTFVSQLHARIFRRDGDLHVEDLGSTNGTYLNQRKVSAPAVIRPGDRLQFGRTTLELRE
jgi:hypothetical protein